jgi:hypothetical protein
MRLQECLDDMTATLMVRQGPKKINVTHQIGSESITLWYIATVQDLFHDIARISIPCTAEDIASNGTYDPLLLNRAPVLENQFDDMARKVVPNELFSFCQELID